MKHQRRKTLVAERAQARRPQKVEGRLLASSSPKNKTAKLTSLTTRTYSRRPRSLLSSLSQKKTRKSFRVLNLQAVLFNSKFWRLILNATSILSATKILSQCSSLERRNTRQKLSTTEARSQSGMSRLLSRFWIFNRRLSKCKSSTPTTFQANSIVALKFPWPNYAPLKELMDGLDSSIRVRWLERSILWRA